MDNLFLAKEWQRIASMDLQTAEYLLAMHPLPIEVICYHCQQSAEKNLKSYLILHDIEPPKTHDLDRLCHLCHRWGDFSAIEDACSDLNAYGVQPRYPMKFTLTEADMHKALKAAKKINSFVLQIAPHLISPASYA